MALSAQTLSAIQTAGAAVFAAEAALKEAAQSYANQVKHAMQENPFDVGNDGLFDDWKTVARLARAVGQVEAEFQKIYRSASDLASGATPGVLSMPVLSTPQLAESADLAMVQEIDATDVVAKKQKKVAKVTTSATPAPVAKSAPSQTLTGNAAKVLERLMSILNPEQFVKINRSAIGVEIGLPKGSIGASISKLTSTGHLIEGGPGQYKLGVPKGT
jgi:hypothetical protein